MTDELSLNELDDSSNSLSISHVEARMEIQTPYLPPQYLTEYERIVEGSAKQMFEMVVAQQNLNMDIKRQEMELNQQKLQRAINIDNANIADQQQNNAIKARGQLLSFVLSLCLIGLSAWFAYLGHVKLASVPILIIVGVITVLFLQKQHSQTPSDKPESNQ